MAFQIKNSLGEGISLHELDKEAAAFWNIPISTKRYAYPLSSTISWFDSIGYVINKPINADIPTWENVKNSLWLTQANGIYTYLYTPVLMNERITSIQIFLRPYFDLIDHWASKGYTPHQVT